MLRDNYTNIDGIDQILPKDLPDNQITLSAIFKSDQLKTKAIITSAASIIILDRYYQSTAAYHWAHDMSYGGHSFNDVNEWKNKGLQSGVLIRPDYTFFIDVEPELSTSRKNRKLVKSGMKAWIREDFLTHMRNYYLSLAQSTDENCILIDGHVTIEQVIAIVLNTLKFDEKGYV